MSAEPLLVIDAGTSGVRAAIIDRRGSVIADLHRPTPPSTPAPGLVEFDAVEYADTAIGTAAELIDRVGPVAGVGISNQRATAVVWDRSTGQPIAPAQGWQDLRTVGECLMLHADGIELAPNLSATKFADMAAANGEGRDLCLGTIDTWLIWRLSRGTAHVTDLSNAGLTGLIRGGDREWNVELCARLGLSTDWLPRIVPTCGFVAEAVALTGAPPILGLAGDQMASLIGQSCVIPGRAKATMGTGGMLDLCRGPEAPPTVRRQPAGTFPIVCWDRPGDTMYGLEAVMLAAGSNIEWLRDDLGLVDQVAETDTLARSIPSSEGVVYVPALLGLGTPQWDYGARGLLGGLTRGSSAAHVVRAVLEGVALRTADLLAAVESDSGLTVESLRLDGGMARNDFFVSAIATAIGRPVEVAPVTEATSLGAAYLAGLGHGIWSGWDEIDALWSPSKVAHPDPDSIPLDRESWARASERALGWLPDLSAIDF